MNGWVEFEVAFVPNGGPLTNAPPVALGGAEGRDPPNCPEVRRRLPLVRVESFESLDSARFVFDAPPGEGGCFNWNEGPSGGDGSCDEPKPKAVEPACVPDCSCIDPKVKDVGPLELLCAAPNRFCAPFEPFGAASNRLPAGRCVGPLNVLGAASVRLPPPPLPRDRAPKQPSPPEPATPSKPPSSGKQQKEKQDSKAAGRAKKRQKIHRPDCEFWDEPLPEPKIKGVSPSKPKKIVPKFEGVPVDEWCGVAGVDFWETSRSRKAHVAAPAAISTQCFIWPICHDVGLYGKVMDVQSARRSIAPLMVDNVLMDMVEAEGASLRPFTSKKRKKDKPNSSNADDDNVEPDEGDAERKDKATWPGLEYLLPVHVTKNLMLDLS